MYLLQMLWLYNEVRKKTNDTIHDLGDRSHDLEEILSKYYEELNLPIEFIPKIGKFESSEDLYVHMIREGMDPFAKLPRSKYNNIVGRYEDVLNNLKIDRILIKRSKVSILFSKKCYNKNITILEHKDFMKVMCLVVGG